MDYEDLRPGDFSAQWDKVILRRHQPTQTKGGILLTDHAKKYMSQPVGEVISMGPSAGWLDQDDPAKGRAFDVGDVVVVGKAAGDWVKLPGSDEELFFCLDVDVLAKVERR